MRTTTRAANFAIALLLTGALAACNKKDDATVVDTTSLGTTTATIAPENAGA